MLKDWLKLIYLKGVKPKQKRKLIDHLKSPSAVFNASREQLLDINVVDENAIGRIFRMNENLAQSDEEKLRGIGADYIGFNDPEYPPLLNQIPSAPLGLFVKGDISLLKTPQIAMVGSRNPSPSGERTTAAFAGELSKLGLTITSGLASGIDSQAHRGCLAVKGNTIAVMGTGLDVIYPKSNIGLLREITQDGLVVSEYPPGTMPRKEHFPQRNRIISGLSLGTLVVEAGMHSGSLITARLAGEQGREVFAIPGSVHSPTSRGCHHLIRQGAKLVEKTSDIIEEIGQYFTSQPIPEDKPSSQPDSESVPDLFRLIDYTPVAFDHLVAQSGLTVDQVSSILVDLELRGLIAETASGYQRLPDSGLV